MAKKKINKTRVLTNAVAKELEEILDDYEWEELSDDDISYMKNIFVQRAGQGYSVHDVVDVSKWFSQTLLSVLDDRKNYIDAYPRRFDDEWYDKHKNEINMEREKWDDIDEDSDPKLYELKEKSEDECLEKWQKILERMIFLLGEMDENTCSKKNAYQEEMDNLFDKYYNKHWDEWERLENEENVDWSKVEDIENDPEFGEEYKKLNEKFERAENGLRRYHNSCKNEFFLLMSQYFWDLGDIFSGRMSDYNNQEKRG